MFIVPWLWPKEERVFEKTHVGAWALWDTGNPNCGWGGGEKKYKLYI